MSVALQYFAVIHVPVDAVDDPQAREVLAKMLEDPKACLADKSAKIKLQRRQENGPPVGVRFTTD